MGVGSKKNYYLAWCRFSLAIKFQYRSALFEIFRGHGVTGQDRTSLISNHFGYPAVTGREWRAREEPRGVGSHKMETGIEGQSEQM